jgi:hypothetical protein
MIDKMEGVYWNQKHAMNQELFEQVEFSPMM